MALVPAKSSAPQEVAGFDGVIVHGQTTQFTGLGGDENMTAGIHYEEEVRFSGVEFTGSRKTKFLFVVAFHNRLSDFADNAVMDDDNEDLVLDSFSEQCADKICQACSCNLLSLCSGKLFNVVGPELIISNRLRKARNLGVKVVFVDGASFPLLNYIVRDIVVAGQLLYTIVGLILSIVNYIRADCHYTFNVINFTLGIIAALLGVAGSAEALYRKNFIRKKCQEPKINSKSDKKRSGLIEVFDLSRTVLAEILIYPLLICSLFSLVTSRPFETRAADNIVGLLRLGLSFASFVAFVYVLRLVILAGAILKLKSTLSHGEMRANWSIYFLTCFFVLVMLQMLVQAFMIVLTGREIYEENLHFYNTSYTDFENITTSCLPVKVSGALWYMIVGTYLFPILGTLMFFVVGYRWMQEFFILAYISAYNLQKTPGIITIFEGKKEVNNLTEKLEHLIPSENIINEFKELYEKSCCTKFCYPFKSPAIVIASIAFLMLNFFFIAFGNDTEITFFGPISFFFSQVNSTGWSLVYFIGTIVGIVANAYTFAVGILWLILLEIVIFIICTLWPCCCLFMICGDRKDSDKT